MDEPREATSPEIAPVAPDGARRPRRGPGGPQHADRVPDRDAALRLLSARLAARPIGVLIVEPDGMGAVGDAHGVAAVDAGDAALCAALRAVAGAQFLGRLDHGRYLVVADARHGDVTEATWRLAEQLDVPVSFALPDDAGAVPRLRLAVGGAVPVPGGSARDALAAARKAVLRSLLVGEPVVLSDPWAGNDARRRLQLATDVARRAPGEVAMVYQPIVDLSSGEMVKVEALLRWTHPNLGPVTPDQALAAADQAGVTGDFLADLAVCVQRDVAAWTASTGRPLAVAFNLSAQQLAVVDPAALLDLLAPAVAATDLTIEVTETSMPVDVHEAVATLETFRRAGSSVAVDDFGAGFASLGYLRRLPADIVKIDREFVDELGTWTTDGSFAQAISELVKRLGLETVAEGVETVAQLEAVSRMGCEYAQGWLFGRPVDMAALLAQQPPAATG